MSGPQLEIVVALPFVLLGVALVAAFAWVPETPGLARARATRGVADRIRGLVQLVGAWLVLTTLTVWCVALVAFLVVAQLAFNAGTILKVVPPIVAAMVGAVGAVAVSNPERSARDALLDRLTAAGWQVIYADEEGSALRPKEAGPSGSGSTAPSLLESMR